MYQAIIYGLSPSVWELFVLGQNFKEEEYKSAFGKFDENEKWMSKGEEYLFATCELVGTFKTRKAAMAYCDDNGISYKK